MTTHTKYCFDTSAFIDSWRRFYRPTSFEQLWGKIGDMVENGTVLIPTQVRDEIKAGNDDLTAWVKHYTAHVVPITKEELDIVRQIVNKYPRVSQYKKPRPYHADPHVIAVAKLNGCAVVTFEKGRGGDGNPSIPALCAEYKITPLSMSDFFSICGWKFDIR